MKIKIFSLLWYLFFGLTFITILLADILFIGIWIASFFMDYYLPAKIVFGFGFFILLIGFFMMQLMMFGSMTKENIKPPTWFFDNG